MSVSLTSQFTFVPAAAKPRLIRSLGLLRGPVTVAVLELRRVLSDFIYCSLSTSLLLPQPHSHPRCLCPFLLLDTFLPKRLSLMKHTKKSLINKI